MVVRLKKIWAQKFVNFDTTNDKVNYSQISEVSLLVKAQVSEIGLAGFQNV